MENYVRAQSVGGIIRSSVEIYRRNFKVLFVTFMIPSLVLIVSLIVAAVEPAPWLSLLNSMLMMIIALFATVPITVVISDVCLGNEPGVARAYRRAFSRVIGTVFLALLLTMLVIGVGLLLLIVPGVMFMLWFPFVMVAVVLERTSALAALKRSRELGRGYYLRNFGTLFLVNTVSMVPTYVIAAVLGAVLAILGVSEVLIAPAGGLVGLFFGPIPAIGTVLLYYDMRVRKEAYDSIKLSEDLRR